MSLSLSIFLVLPQISLVKYYETIKILMQIFSYFKLHFHNEGLDCQKNYFEMFFCDWPLLSSWKISAFTVQPFTFFFIKRMAFFIIFVGKIFFLQNIYGFTPVKKILSHLDQKWAQTKQLLSKKFQLPIAMEGCIVHWNSSQCCPGTCGSWIDFFRIHLWNVRDRVAWTSLAEIFCQHFYCYK